MEWTAKRGQSRSKSSQQSPTAATPTSSHSLVPNAYDAATQGPAISAGGGDQPPKKNIPISLTCQGGPQLVIGNQPTAKEKEVEKEKDSGSSPIFTPHISSSPSPQITPIPSPHTTPPPSPHYNPILSGATPVLKPHGSPIQVVEIGD